MSYYNGYSVNPATGITTFYGETLADLALMPTTTKEGEGVYQYGTAIEGSYARILSTDGLSIYMLRSSGWVEVTDIVGSTTYSTDPITGVTTFYGENNADLALMPTTTKEGEGQYVYGFAAEGSYAKILESDNLKIYMLRSTGWIDVTDTIGGGGGSGGGTAETTTYDNTDSGLEATNVQDAIDELAENRGTFTSGGNKTFSQLDTPSESNLNIIYNITDAFTSDNRFNDGGGKNYPAGTNVACSNVGTTENPVYKYDVFNGSYTVDNALSDVSENPVQNKIVKGALDEKEDEAIRMTYAQYQAAITAGTIDPNKFYCIPDAPGVEFDSALSDVSENAVQNKVIKAALDVKADTSAVNSALALKVDKVEGKGLSANDYTNAEKSTVDNSPISSSVSGINPSITDSADGLIQDVKVYGRSHVSKNICTGFEQGSISSTGDVESSSQLRTPAEKSIKVTAGTTYTFSCEATKSTQIAVIFYDSNNGFISGGNWTNVPASVTMVTGAAYCRLILRYNDTSNIIPSDITNGQFELGSTATPYEPYGIISIGDSGSLAITTANSDSSESSTAPLTTGLPLCGIPVTTGETYTDEQGQKWLADTADVEGVEKRCGVVDLGELGWTYNVANSLFFAYLDSAYTRKTIGVNGVCVEYPVTTEKTYEELDDKTSIIGTAFVSSTVGSIVVKDTNYTDTATFKAAVTGVKLVYPLAEPTTTPLTSAELSALLALRTFNSTTNVAITDDPFVDISYLKNTANGKAIAQLSENLMSMLSGGTPTFSFARAVYDAGDTVTATDGTTTLTSDTSGDYVFAIPNSGTWTFSDGKTTITKSLTTYGEITKCNLISLLPASVEKNILAEIRAGHFNLGEDVGEGFKATNSNTFSLAEDGSLVTSATGHVYYDLVSANQPATIYFVGKCPDDTTITRVMARHHANSSGESPGFYTESNKILNATYYGSNSPTSISKTSLFVCAMSLSVTGSYKWAYYYVNDTFTTNKNLVNAGRYCYFTGTSVTANTPTDTTEFGDAVTISYIGIVNGAEDATTIATNIAAIMAAFEIS